jgi:hypothetical protein
MNIFVFTGPTLTAAEGAQVLAATYLPPAAQGDVYRVARRRPAGRRPAGIGIIDGYFESVPAIWHKEILWAMEQGIPVFGAASLGALRAAELHNFGMRGVGRIFEDYRDGRLEDDDEVAVLHGPAELGFSCLTDPMVNIRATLEEAVRAGIISNVDGATLANFAKAQFYKDRRFPQLLEQAEKLVKLDLSSKVPIRLREWVRANYIDQKKRDALSMLAVMRRDLVELQSPPPAVSYQTEHTEWWDALQRGAGDVIEADDAVCHLPGGLWLDEIRLDFARYRRVFKDAMISVLAQLEAQRSNIVVSHELIQSGANDFRAQLGLQTPEQSIEWLRRNGLDLFGFTDLVERDLAVRLVCARLQPQFVRAAYDVLKLRNEFELVAARARSKEQFLAERGIEIAAPEHTGLTEVELLAWLFRRNGLDAIVDVEACAHELGYDKKQVFLCALAREYLYTQETEHQLSEPAVAMKTPTGDMPPNSSRHEKAMVL